MTAPDLDLDLARSLLLNRPAEQPAEDLLYSRWYHRTDEAIHIMPPAGAYLASILSPDLFEDGWVVRRTGMPGMVSAVEVERAGVQKIVAPPDLFPEDPHALTFAPGMPVRVNPLSGYYADGFWHLFSPSWQTEGPEEDRHRLYVSVRRGAEPAFVRAFAEAADWQAKWSMKILCGPGLDGRCDTAVAYLPRAAGTKTGWVANLIQRVAPFATGKGPPLTQELAPGIFLAPEIEADRSFGQLLCQALMAAAEDGAVLADPSAWRSTARSALDALLARGAQQVLEAQQALGTQGAPP